MNTIMAMTALAASLMVSTAAVAAPANLEDAIAPDGVLTLVRGGGGGGGGHMGSLGGGGGGAAHFGGNGHFDNDHVGRADFGHGRNQRFYPGVFGYGGDYADYGYSGGCSWLRREAIATGSPLWWQRYQACL